MTALHNPKKQTSTAPATVGALAGIALALTLGTTGVHAADNIVSIKTSGDQRCMTSNGIPDHTTGTFPNSGNPHSISVQNIELCVPANPTKGSTARQIGGTIGFALNGIIIRPGTADWYDASSPRGHSRDRSSGWNLEGLGAREMLGMDENNAHVDNNGIYHYHGVAQELADSTNGSLIGYAADGHEIHYVGSAQSSSWQLKSGTRPTEPGGTYDGTYNQDWQYVAGSGSLDECNGGILNGEYVYFATHSYPFFPRCVFGEVSSDFRMAGGGGQGGPGSENGQRPTDAFQQASNQGQNSLLNRLFGNRPQARSNNSRRQSGFQNNARQGQGGRNGPPQIAVAACNGEAAGEQCSFQSPRNGRSVEGVCRITPEQVSACVPNGRRPHG